MIRKSHFQNLRGFDEQLGLAADMDLALKLTRSTLVGAICEPLVSYRTHSGQMHQNLDQVIREHSYVIANSFDDPKVQRQLLSDLAVYADLKRLRSESSLRNAVSATGRFL
ncbi:hypothetical protein JZU54_01755, partial [bacterium]|nr:hypothetical protein [bacterium]